MYWAWFRQAHIVPASLREGRLSRRDAGTGVKARFPACPLDCPMSRAGWTSDSPGRLKGLHADYEMLRG